MDHIYSAFPEAAKRFLYGVYPAALPTTGEKDNAANEAKSFNVPTAPKDHWGLHQQLPKFDELYTFKRLNGRIVVCEQNGEEAPEFADNHLSKEEFLDDFERMTSIIDDPPMNSFCKRRLAHLKLKYESHILFNDGEELYEQEKIGHRDFYNTRKVDNHIHAAVAMNQKHLLSFLKKKAVEDADKIVSLKDKKPVTMNDVFQELGVDTYYLTVDVLDVHADRMTSCRFDKFNNKYIPVGNASIRDIFLKTDNYTGGMYFAELLKEVFADLNTSKYYMAEPRLSIYGRKRDEWEKLAHWALNHDVWSPNVRWLIQIPRVLYPMIRRGVAGNDEHRTNLPDPRMMLRYENLVNELSLYYAEGATKSDLPKL